MEKGYRLIHLVMVTFCKIDKLNIDNKRDNTDDDEYIIISIDDSGIKVTNRGQWMNEKWNTQNRERCIFQYSRNCKHKD